MQRRQALVLFHRYAGLSMSGFLLVAGLTGALLAWNDEIEAISNPSLFLSSAAAPDAPLLDPLVLQGRVAAMYPDAEVWKAPLHIEAGRSLSFFLAGKRDAATGQAAALPNDQVFVDPRTGAWLGERKWGDPAQGTKNLMPFIYRLHDSWALGAVGTFVFGIVALLWSVDCFVGAFLTFPAGSSNQKKQKAQGRSRGWLARWMSSWKLRWGQGGYKLKFDLHRAGGLWLWMALFAVAWSAVGFNLPQVHGLVMASIFARQTADESPTVSHSAGRRLDWMQARETGRRLMAEQSALHDFRILQEDSLRLDADKGEYCYAVRSSLDVRKRSGETRVCFDAASGFSRGVWMPTDGAGGDTITSWLAGFHMAALWGRPFKVFTTVLGLAVAGLCATGLWIWLRKRHGRQRLSMVVPAVFVDRHRQVDGAAAESRSIRRRWRSSVITRAVKCIAPAAARLPGAGEQEK